MSYYFYFTFFIWTFILPIQVQLIKGTSTPCGNSLNWTLYNDTCYYFSEWTDAPRSMYDARALCNSNGAHLASIHSADENYFILLQIADTNISDYWIGLNDLSTNKFTWFDNTVVDFEFWSPGEPNDAYGGERCVALNSITGSWSDENCNVYLGFVCRKPANSSSSSTITQAPPALIDGGCTSGFTPMPNGNKCFLIEPKTKTNWTNARRLCRNYGKGHDIASINSAEEQAFLIAMMKGINNSYGLWIGLNNLRHRGHFVWQDNSPFTYENWAPNEPNGHLQNKNSMDCVTIYPSSNPWITKENVGTWNDMMCSAIFGFICQGQKDKNILAPTSPQGTQCKPGYEQYYTECYKLFSLTDWINASTSCAKDGGNLTSVLDIYEDSFIKSAFLKLNQPVWIGMAFSEDMYIWHDGWPVLYTNWGRGQPFRESNGGCVAIVNGQWSDMDCSTDNSYICKISTAKPPPKTKPPPGRCRSGQVHHGDFCYKEDVFASLTWSKANGICKQVGMDLVSIHSTDELTFVWKNLMLGKGIPKGFTGSPPEVWIGLSKGLANGYSWTDGTAVNLLNWSPYEPTNPLNSTREQCVEMYRWNGKWSDANCSSPHGYICKGLATKTTIPMSTSTTTTTKARIATSPTKTSSPLLSTITGTQINSKFLPSTRSPSSYTRINTEMKSKATASQSSQAYSLDTSTSAYSENSKLWHTKFMNIQPTTEDGQELTETTGSTSRSSSNGAKTAAITVSVISIVIIVVVVLFFLKRYGYFRKHYNLGFDNKSFYYDKSVDYIETQNKD